MNHGSQNIQQEGRECQDASEAEGCQNQSGAGQGEAVAEEWRSVVGYEGIYGVSNMGRLRSLDRISCGVGKRPIKGKVFARCVDDWGYVQMVLGREGERKTRKISRLIATAFIPNPDNKPTANHINGIKNDDRVCNLEWATYSEQQLHAHGDGLRSSKKGEAHKNAKLTEIQVSEIRASFDTAELLGRRYLVNPLTIRRIQKGEKWAHSLPAPRAEAELARGAQ